MAFLVPRKTLRDLLVMKLQSLYDVECELVRAWLKMAKKATDPDLRTGFAEHREETREHVARLEGAIQELTQKKARKMRDSAIRGLVEDATWVMTNVKGRESLDVGLISAARYVEHYEIAGYDTALSWATLLGYHGIGDALRRTLEEERMADGKLAELAALRLNERALPGGEREA